MKLYEVQRLQKLAGIKEAFISAPGAKFIIGDTVYDRWDNDKNPLEIIDTAPNMSSIPETPGKSPSLSWDDVSNIITKNIDNYWYKARPIGKKLALWYPQDELSFSPSEGPLEEAFIGTPGGDIFKVGDTVYDKNWWTYDENPSSLVVISKVNNASLIPSTDSLNGLDPNDYDPNKPWYKTNDGQWYPQEELTFSPYSEGPLEEAFISSPGSFDFKPGDTVEFIYPDSPEVLSIKNYMKQYYFSKNPDVYQVYRVYNNDKYNNKPSLQLANDEGYITHVALPQYLFTVVNKATKEVDNRMGYPPEKDLKDIIN